MKNSDLLTLFGDAPEKVLTYLFDRLPVGTAVIDREFRLRRCNPTWAEFIERYTPSAASDAVPGVSLFDLEPGTEAVLKPLFAPVFAGEIVRQEGIRLQSDGIVSYWDVVLVPLEVDGEVVAALDVSMDVTSHIISQQKLENTLQALQESEANLRAMLENAQGYAIYRIGVDLDHPFLGRVILVSPSMRAVAGVEDIYDFSSWFNNIHPDDEARVLAANQNSIENGVAFDEEMRFYNKQRGEWRWVHTVSNPTIDENGRLTHFNGMTIDITAQKQAQETLSHINQALERQVAERTRKIEAQHREEQRHYHESERRRLVAEGLRDILAQLNYKQSLPDLLDAIVDQSDSLLDSDSVALYLLSEEENSLKIHAARGQLDPLLRDVTLPVGVGTIGQVVAQRQPLVVPNVSDLPIHTDKETANELETAVYVDAARQEALAAAMRQFQAVLGLPLIAQDVIYGGLAFYYQQPQTFSDEEINLATIFADQAALAIQNARLRDNAEQMAVLDERNRLARELHDAVTQTLFSASLIADVLPRIWERDSEMGRAKLSELRELTRGALAEMRTLLLELRPATLAEVSLAELLRQLTQAIGGRSRLPIELNIAGERPLPPETQIALYRIAQEALNNISKHAGASQVTLTVDFLPQSVRLTIADNGRGFNPDDISHTSLGLGIMQERAQRIGAALTIDSQIGAGTTVTVHGSIANGSEENHD